MVAHQKCLEKIAKIWRGGQALFCKIQKRVVTFLFWAACGKPEGLLSGPRFCHLSVPAHFRSGLSSPLDADAPVDGLGAGIMMSICGSRYVRCLSC